MRTQFVFSEMLNGLRRNLTMTIAVIVTTALTLALAGGAWLLRDDVNRIKGRFSYQFEVKVYTCAPSSTEANCSGGAATPAQVDAIRQTLTSLPVVRQVQFQTSQQAYQDFKVQFRDQPALVANVQPDSIPPTFRVQLTDPKRFDVVSSALQSQPGVQAVQDQRQLLDRVFNFFDGFQAAAIAFAVIQVLAAVLLIANTIRLAAFSRRRETGIMRLVGASNLYIQLPFLLEGALAGMVGGVIACGGLFAAKAFLLDGPLARLFAHGVVLPIDYGRIWLTVPFLVVGGIVLAALASFVTLRRYLRV